MRKNFVKTKEDFTCENCNQEVKGDGYTDHCPKCLYGNHVDENVPGDRKATCKGPLKPMGITKKGGKTQIEYVCEKCGKHTVCKVSEEDNIDEVIALSSHQT